MSLNRCGPPPHLSLQFLKTVCSLYLSLPVDPSVPASLHLYSKLAANKLTPPHIALPKEFLSTSSPELFLIYFY